MVVHGELLTISVYYWFVVYRVQLEKQFEEKARKAVENARLQWEGQQRQETNKQCEDAVQRQQELWANERRENQTALERVKHELATVKKEYGITIEKLRRGLAEERKKTKYNLKRQDSRTDAAQVSNSYC